MSRSTLSSATPAPLELLEQLAGWLGNSGFGPDHPWQLSIAATLKAYGRSAPVDSSSVDAVDRALCRARVCAEAGAAYVEQQEVDGTQLVPGEVVELFNAVADVVRDARQQLRASACASSCDRP